MDFVGLPGSMFRTKTYLALGWMIRLMGVWSLR